MCIYVMCIYIKSKQKNFQGGCATPPNVPKLVFPACRIPQTLSKNEACHVANKQNRVSFSN